MGEWMDERMVEWVEFKPMDKSVGGKTDGQTK